MSKLCSSVTRFSKVLSLGALFAALSSAALAQVVISNVSYSTPVNGTGDVSVTGLTYSDYTTKVSTVTAAGLTYNLNASSSTASVYVRRADSAGTLPTLVAFQSNGAGSTYSSQYGTTGALLASGNPYAALLNPFTNDRGSNIERIDTFYGAATTVQASDGLAFFGLDMKTGDSFRVALITGWDAANKVPTFYSSQTVLVTINSSTAAPALSTPDGLNAGYQVAGFRVTDSLSGAPEVVFNIPSLALGGILVRFSDFGLADGTTILGYSVLAGDGTVTTGQDLLTSSLYDTVYPSTTGTSGGFNFAGFNTAIASPVPEPGTYGLVLTAGSLGFFAWSRRRLSRSQAKA